MGWGGTLTISRRLLALMSLATPLIGSAIGADAFPELQPGFRLTEASPYRVYSDEPDSEVRQLVTVLTGLRRDFEQHFAPLLTDHGAPRQIEVLYFGRPADFRRYAERVAPALADSAGFYCSQNNRLVLASQRALASRPSAAAAAAPLRVPGVHYFPAVRHLPPTETWRMTERLIRHEGAHQLFSQYQLHSRFALEPTWITEGLAEYCVPERIGAAHPIYVGRLVQARRAGGLISLEALLNQRDPNGFFAWGGATTELAYAQSWGLVWFLMQQRYRDQFLELLQFYRDTDAVRARTVEDTEPLRLLLAYLGVDRATFEGDWKRFLESLPDTPPITVAETDG